MGRGLKSHANQSGYKSAWISNYPKDSDDYAKFVKARIASRDLPTDESEFCQHCPKAVKDVDHNLCHVT